MAYPHTLLVDESELMAESFMKCRTTLVIPTHQPAGYADMRGMEIDNHSSVVPTQNIGQKIHVILRIPGVLKRSAPHKGREIRLIPGDQDIAATVVKCHTAGEGDSFCLQIRNSP